MQGLTTHWEKILIDTTVIVKVINYKKHGKSIHEFANHLMEYLANSDAQITPKKTAKRKFYVSAITIAELIDATQPVSTNKTKLIVQALNANNLEIVDFDEEVADVYDLSFVSKLGINFPRGLLSKWGGTNSKPNREMLTKDLMILGCGLYKEVDAVLCFDKGMYKIGREFGINTVYIDPKYFNYNDKYVFEFYASSCDKDLK